MLPRGTEVNILFLANEVFATIGRESILGVGSKYRGVGLGAVCVRALLMFCRFPCSVPSSSPTIDTNILIVPGSDIEVAGLSRLLFFKK